MEGRAKGCASRFSKSCRCGARRDAAGGEVGEWGEPPVLSLTGGQGNRRIRNEVPTSSSSMKPPEFDPLGALLFPAMILSSGSVQGLSPSWLMMLTAKRNRPQMSLLWA